MTATSVILILVADESLVLNLAEAFPIEETVLALARAEELKGEWARVVKFYAQEMLDV